MLAAQNIGHAVQAGWLPRQKLRGIDGPPDEAIAIGRPVAEFERFAHHAEDDRMIARRIARANRVDADLVARALADLAVAAVDEPGDARRLGRDLGQLEGRSAGGSLS